MSSDYVRVKSVVERFGSVTFEIPEINALVVEVPAHLLSYLRYFSSVRYVEEDKPVKTSTEVQWNVEIIEGLEV
ncbi:MAG: hypothetical protein QN229_04805 [Desulfurococcaceae archaeon TW002]